MKYYTVSDFRTNMKAILDEVAETNEAVVIKRPTGADVILSAVQAVDPRKEIEEMRKSIVEMYDEINELKVECSEKGGNKEALAAYLKLFEEVAKKNNSQN